MTPEQLEARRANDLVEKRLAMEQAQIDQKAKEDKAASGPMGILSSVLGMGASIGGMIPSLLAGPQEDELRKFQQGRGAGATAARQAGSEAGRRVAGNMGGRGSQGNVRAGLRSAEEIAGRGAQAASIMGAREGLAATQMLRQNDLIRRNAFKTLGAGVGQGLAGIGGMLAASKDQGPVQPVAGEATDTLPGEAALLEQALPQNVDPATGLSIPSTATGEAQQTAAAGAAGVGQLGAARTAAGISPPTPGQQEAQGRFTEPGSFTGEMEQARTAGALQGPDMSGVAAQQAANLAGLAQVTAEKQDAADGYRRAIGDKATLISPNTRTPALDLRESWQREAEDWAYREAENYNPMMQLGLNPEQVGLMIIDWGGQPDWERLGVQPTLGGKGALSEGALIDRGGGSK
jgi:hypothetical protein